MEATRASEPVSGPIQAEPLCPGCGGTDIGFQAGYAFCSVPSAVPVWEEAVWCGSCGWSEERIDGAPAGGRVDAFLAALPVLPEGDDDFPPF